MTTAGASTREIQDARILREWPQPLAIAWARVSHSADPRTRLAALDAFAGTFLSTLAWLAVNSLLPLSSTGGPAADSALGLKLGELVQRPSLGSWVEALNRATGELNKRNVRAPLAVDLCETLRPNGTEPAFVTYAYDVIRERNERAHANEPTLSTEELYEAVRRTEEPMRRMLARTAWLERWTIVTIDGVRPQPDRTNIGTVATYRGADIVGARYPLRWTGPLSPDALYLCNAEMNVWVQLDPLLRARHTQGESRIEVCTAIPKLGHYTYPRGAGNTATVSKAGRLQEGALSNWLPHGVQRVPSIEVAGHRPLRVLAPTPTAELLAGRYRVTKLLGEGAMAQVWRARDETLGRDAAIKVLRAELSTDLKQRERFLREARLLASIEHPNLLPVYETGTDRNSRAWFASPLLPGGTLAQRIEERGADTATAIRVLIGIGSALDTLHGRGILHRDVKPANVLFAVDDRPILADLGVARDTNDHTLTRTGQQPGSPAYMAPEHLRGRAEPASDVFALAITAHEAATGQLPRGRAGVGVAGPLGTLLRRMSEPDAENRPSAAEVVRAARELALDASGVARATPPAPATQHTPAMQSTAVMEPLHSVAPAVESAQSVPRNDAPATRKTPAEPAKRIEATNSVVSDDSTEPIAMEDQTGENHETSAGEASTAPRKRGVAKYVWMSALGVGVAGAFAFVPSWMGNTREPTPDSAPDLVAAHDQPTQTNAEGSNRTGGSNSSAGAAAAANDDESTTETAAAANQGVLPALQPIARTSLPAGVRNVAIGWDGTEHEAVAAYVRTVLLRNRDPFDFEAYRAGFADPIDWYDRPARSRDEVLEVRRDVARGSLVDVVAILDDRGDFVDLIELGRLTSSSSDSACIATTRVVSMARGADGVWRVAGEATPGKSNGVAIEIPALFGTRDRTLVEGASGREWAVAAPAANAAVARSAAARVNQRCARPADDRYRRFWRLPTEAELRGLETLLRDAEALRSVWVTTLPCEVCDRAATTPGAVAVEENGQPRLVPWMGGSIDGPAPTFVLAVRSSE